MEKYTGLEIAVIGISGRFPEAGDITEYWENLKAGRDSISSFSDEELLEEGVTASQIADPAYVKSNAYLQEKDHFDAAFFDYRPGESALMDPQMRIFHECCWEALEDSGYIDPVNNNVGVFSTGSLNVNWVLYAMLKNKDGEVDNLTASYLRDINFLSSRISYKFNLKGPSVFIQTACSSSLVTIHEACNSLLLGECSMALAGGVTVRNYSKKGHRYEEGMIHSKDGKCRPFDAGSSGTVGGEGAGVVVLKRLKDAIRDRDHVYAVIKGTGINNDGRNKVGYTAPSSQGQAEAIKKALKMAQISPQSIGYIETHGTATELGDPIEIEALNLAFASSGGARFCAIGSVKSNIGHLDNAAGIASFIKAVLVIKHGQIPASLHFNSPNPKIDFKGGPFYVNHTLKDWDTQAGPRRAGVSSFGIGGTNAHIILEQAPERQNLAESRKHQLLVLSGKTKRSLERNLVKLKAHLKNSNDDALADIAYTLQNGRSRFKYRKFVVCENKEEAIDLLAEGDLTNAAEAGVQEHLQNIVFMFPGQGAQYHDMCRDLYETESFFKEKVEECLSVASRYSIEDFKSALFFGDDSNKINDTKFTQPILFIIEYALAQLLMSWGIKPDYMIGHSIGEYVAACISGVFTLEDALKLVIRRGELMGQVERGSMLSIKINEDSLLPLLTERRCLDIAAVNGSDSIVVSGRDADVMNFGEVLTRGGYEFRKVSTSHAFHSHMMDDLLSEFEAEFTTVTIGQPRIPYISNITGMLIDYEEILKPAYWSRHLRNTVLFSSGAETLLKMGNAMFIEIGPGKTLSNYISQSVYFDKGHQVLNTVRHQAQQEKDQKYLIEKLGRLWQNGIKIDWAGYYTKEERSRISLPKYSFEKTSYTAIVDAYQLINKNVDDALPLLATAPEDLINISTWQRSVLLNDVKFPKEASVILVFCGKESFSNSLISDLVDAGQRVIEVRSGASFVRINDDRFQANILSPEDLQAFWNHLKTVGLVVDQVIYCVALDDHLTSAEINDIEKVLNSGYLGLSFLAKSIANNQGAKKVNLTIVNNHLAAVTATDQIHPLKATIQGPAKVIPLEFLQLRCKVVDIPYPFSDEKELKKYSGLLINESFFDSEEPFVAYRYEERWLPSFCPLNEREKINSGQDIVRGGTYMITGGMGGMGFKIAEDLVHQHGANVLLVFRSDFPLRKDWDDWLLTKEKEDPISLKIQQILKMEDQGRRVDLAQVDLSDEEAVSGLIARVKNRYPKINGLIWAAGEVDYGGVILNRNRTDFEKYISSKVYGLLFFEKYWDLEQLDFVALFSSIGNVFYQAKFGQVAYVAANEFLESFSYYLRKRSGVHAFTINWCDWLDVGMTVNIRKREGNTEDMELINSKISDGLYPKEGLAVFHACLRQKAAVSTIYKGNLQKAINDHRSNYNEIKGTLIPEVPLFKPEETNQAGETDPEGVLISIYSRFFGIEKVKLTDSFFELGGDSLRAMTLAARISQHFSVHVSMSDVYNFHIIGEFLKEIEGRALSTKVQRIPKSELKDSYALSSAQKRMYFLQIFDLNSVVYNEVQYIHLKGCLDKVKIENTFRQLIDIHESLRTSFIFENSGPRQIIQESVDFNLSYFMATEERVNTVISDFVRPFDLSSAPLLRVGLIEVAEEEHLLLIDMHHIISDGVSKDLLIRDFMALYQGQHLNPLALQYKDYAEWQQSEAQQLRISKHRDFWLQEFSVPVESLELPYDYPRPLVAADQGSSLSFELNASEQLALKKLAEEEQVSMFMVILSVYVILLGKLGNQEDIVVGSPAAGRDHADLEGLVGMFVNTLALRNYPAGGLRYVDFLQDLKERTLNCFDHQSYPYEELIDELKTERERGRNPLFDVMFSYRNFEESTLSLPGLVLDRYQMNEGVSKFDLTLSATDKQDRISFHLEYATSLYKEETILRMVSYFRRIVSVIISDRSVQLSSISVLSDAERETLLYGFNATERDYPKQESLVSLFDRQAFLNPAAMAVVYGDTQQSYKLLKEKSDRIGGYLREKYGLSKGELVGLMVERGVDLMALIFGILKAGCAYVPVDSSYPSSRKEAIISGSGMKLLISGVAESGLEYPGNCPVVFQEVLLAAAGSYQGDVEAVLLNGNDLAYVIYTSGSTGQPKGVMIEHHAVVNRLLWMQKQYPLSGNDVLLQKTPLVFDVSVWELFWWMLSGAGLCILEPGSEKDPALLSSAISRYRITAVHFVPSMLSVFLSALQGSADYGLLESLRWVFSSGEALKADQVDSFGAGLHEHCGTGLINLYGPTEATVDVSYYECRFGEGHLSIPIGRPIDNLQLYVLGPHQELLPLGVCGELCIGGVGLARGYLNNTGLTAERFIDHPHIPGKKIYRTGDLVKWLPDGEIGYIGRMDDQVKLRGFRIELGEIEYHLSEHDQVVSAAVVVKEQAGDKCLVAYYVAEAEIESLVLKAYLLDKLPNYMVPAYFVHLNAFPLTTNGKLDKKRLPEPEVKIGPGFIAPANETEKDLAEVWAGILGISEASISADRSFFDFGGNSILALRLIYAIQSRFQIQVTLRTVFENVTIRELSILIKNGIDSAGMKIRKAEARAYYPASAAQQRLFYEQLFDRNNIRYNISGIYEFREDGDPSKIERTFQSLINRHEGLRTTFSLGDEGVVQTIHEVLDFEITVRELEGGDIKDIFKTFIKPFNLAVCPLIRCEYVRNKNGDDLLMVDIHHIVCDGLSLNILMNDFKDIYQGKTLKPLNLTYVDYACWQEEDKLYLEKQREFWKQQLSGALPVTDLLTKQDRELVDVHPALVKILEIEGDSYEKIKKMAISSGVSDFMFLLSVHYILLSKMTGETDIIIGTDAMGRGNLDLQDMVGTFVNVLPLRVEVVPEMMFIDFLMSVKECVLGAFDHQDFQYDQLISMLNEQQALQRNLFDVHFSFSNVLDKPADEADWKIVPFKLDTRASAHYEITIEVKEKKEQFEMLFVFSEALYEEETIEALMTYYHQILDQVMASHDITIENITI